MSVTLTKASLARLDGVHPHLVSVIKAAAETSAVQFQVTCGVRSLAAQRKLVRDGYSRTLKSRHIPAPNGLSHAVDLVVMQAGKPVWAPAAYHRLADVIKTAARSVGVTVEWGGDWGSFFDGPHFQLPWSNYPGVASVADAAPPQPTGKELATLVPGSRGSAVMDLQRDLNSAFPGGLQLTVDGDYGPATRRAVQSAAGALIGKDTDIVTAALRDKIAAAARKAARNV